MFGSDLLLSRLDPFGEAAAKLGEPVRLDASHGGV